MPKPILTEHVMSNFYPSFYHFFYSAGTRQRKPVCGTENYSTLLSTIFTLADFMFKSVIKPKSLSESYTKTFFTD